MFRFFPAPGKQAPAGSNFGTKYCRIARAHPAGLRSQPKIAVVAVKAKPKNKKEKKKKADARGRAAVDVVQAYPLSTHVKVFFPSQNQFYAGFLTDFKDGLYSIAYADGDVERLSLQPGQNPKHVVQDGSCGCCGLIAPVVPAGPLLQGLFFDAVAAGKFSVDCETCGKRCCASHVSVKKDPDGQDQAFLKLRARVARMGYACAGFCTEQRRQRLQKEAALKKSVEEADAALKKEDKEKAKQLKRKVDDDEALEKEEKKIRKQEEKEAKIILDTLAKTEKRQNDAAAKQETERFHQEMRMNVATAAYQSAVEAPGHVPLVFPNSVLHGVLQDIIMQLRQDLVEPGQVKCSAVSTLALSLSPSAFQSIEVQTGVGFAGKKAQFTWGAPLHQFDAFFQQPLVVGDQEQETHPFFTSWREAIPDATGVRHFKGKMHMSYCFETQELKASCSCGRV